MVVADPRSVPTLRVRTVGRGSRSLQDNSPRSLARTSFTKLRLEAAKASRRPALDCVLAKRPEGGKVSLFHSAVRPGPGIPNRSTKSPERKREQRKRWFRDGQKWRTGCEGRISVVKRRHGLDRCRYKGPVGMDRWVGLGVIADNVVNISRTMEKQAAP
jgi:Transposase DDE domain